MRQPKAESYFIIAIISLRENWRVVHGGVVLHQCSDFLAVNRDAKICAVWVSGLFCFFLKSNISLNSGIKLIVLHNLPPAHDTRHQTPDGNIIYITIIQENFFSVFYCTSLDKSVFYHVYSQTFTNSDLSTNGHRSTTATFFGRQSICWLLFPLSTTATFFFPQGGRVWRS